MMRTGKWIIQTVIVGLVLVGLGGCGGDPDPESVTITQCVTPEDLSTYQTLNEGDIINDASPEDGVEPKLYIYQTSTGEKKVCTQSGNAVIIRS